VRADRVSGRRSLTSTPTFGAGYGGGGESSCRGCPCRAVVRVGGRWSVSRARRVWGAGPQRGLPVIPSPRGGGMERFGVPGGWDQSS
jgi:hypothetical protein